MKKLLILVWTTCLFLCCGTSDETLTGTTDEQTTGHPVVAGVFFAPDGATPAGNAAVYIRLKNELIDTNNLVSNDVDPYTSVAFTDGNGRFAIDSLDTGMYVIEGTSGNNRVMIDSVHIINPKTTIMLPPETLKPAGAIKGVISLTKGDDPRRVFVLAYGIGRFVQVSQEGTFMLKSLAEGKLDLRIISLINDYGVVDTFGIPVKSADTTDLDTIKLLHIDIPPPTNLQVGYDTLRQTVLLRWTPADTGSIDGYNIYRAIKGQNSSLLILKPLPKTVVAFNDSTVQVGQTYEYHIVSRKSSGEESHVVDIQEDTVLAVSSSLVTTTFNWILPNTLNDTASIGDSVSFIVNCTNPTRKIESVLWYGDSSVFSAKVKNGPSLTVVDTMRIAWPVPGKKRIIVRAVDAAKTGWSDTTVVYVIQDVPLAAIQCDASVPIKTPITFTAKVTQRFGVIVKYEWKFGSQPWVMTSSNDTTVIAPTTSQAYACSLRVTDDDKNIAFDAKNVMVLLEHQGQMVKIIAAGQSFQMGETSLDDPVHKVTFSYDFWMDTTEVEQTDFLALMGFNPSNFGSLTKGPVEAVTWFDAVLYCNARSKRDGLDSIYDYTAKMKVGDQCTSLTGLAVKYTNNGYRLPTEAEWEYACRSGTTSSYYWGESNEDTTMGLYAWYNTNSGNTTHAVAGKQPNSFGLYDMNGNVEEWCNDWFGDYSTAPQTNPTGPTNGSYRILRGGSWERGDHYLRSASRTYVAPVPLVVNDGFRVCRRAQ
jgi:formylglycine-generating enzyme required for sulfatase activity